MTAERLSQIGAPEREVAAPARAAPSPGLAAGPAPARLLALQRTAGNTAVSRVIRSGLLHRQHPPTHTTGSTPGFDDAVTAGDWPAAFQALDQLDTAALLARLRDSSAAAATLWGHVDAAPAGVRIDRLTWADQVVTTHRLVDGGPTAEIPAAVAFLAAKRPADRDKVFGWPLSSIGPHHLTARFVTRLRDGERRAREIVAQAGLTMLETQADWEIDSISCGGGGNHARGCAVDINYHSCPYVIGEALEGDLDRRAHGGFDSLAAVYDRIARVMLSRASSAIPQLRSGTNKTRATDTSAAAAVTYERLRGEHEAMRQYFDHLGRPDAELQALLDEFRMFEPAPGGFYPTLVDAASLRHQMAMDYLALGGSKASLRALAGSLVDVTTLPNPPTVDRAPDASGVVRASDRPFAGGDATRRPERGFLNVRREIVLGLTAAGMRWGASEMGAESGDIMHFDAAGDA